MIMIADGRFDADNDSDEDDDDVADDDDGKTHHYTSVVDIAFGYANNGLIRGMECISNECI